MCIMPLQYSYVGTSKQRDQLILLELLLLYRGCPQPHSKVTLYFDGLEETSELVFIFYRDQMYCVLYLKGHLREVPLYVATILNI